MEIKKRKKSFALAIVLALVCLTTDCWATENIKIGMLDYTTVSSGSQRFASELDDSFIDRKLVFDFNGMDDKRVRVWSSDNTIRIALRTRQLKENLIDIGDFEASLNSNGELKVDIEALIMEVTILYAIDAEEIIEVLVDEVTMAALVQVVNLAYKDKLRSASALKNFLLAYEHLHDIQDISDFVDEVLTQVPDVPQLIKDNLFIYQVESSPWALSDPCNNVVNDFVYGQVSSALIDPIWDPICRGTHPLVKRFRDPATCKLIPTYSPTDGKLYVYGQYCSLESYAFFNTVSSSYTYPFGGDSDATNSNPYVDADDVHITHHHIRPFDIGSWHEQVDIDLGPGQSFEFHTQARVENRSNHDLEDIDIDYLIVKDKKDFDIPHSQRKRLDDDKVDIDEGDKENKTMAKTRVSISSDFTTIKVDCLGRHDFTFPITQENINEREITLYFYIDVETESGDDRDVSDEMKTDEFGKLEINLPHFNSWFVASTTEGEASLTVDFTNLSEGSPGSISSYLWDFDDGATSTEASPSHTFTTPGTKNITLATTSSWGEVKTAIATIEVIEAQEPYIFSSAQTAENVNDLGGGEYEAVNPTTTFELNDPIHILAKLTDATTSFRWKCDIYHEGVYWWTTETEWRSAATFDYFTFIQDGHTLGTFTFEVFIDDGDGYELHATLNAVVSETPPPPPPDGDDYVYQDTVTAEGVNGDTPINQKSTFNLGQYIHVLSRATEINVNHKWKIDIFHEDNYWWTMESPQRTATDDDFFSFSQEGHTAGTYTFKVHLITIDDSQLHWLQNVDAEVLP
ncbi:MAG: PKD domain-containing protein [Patescibacteria group bacterium]|nr:PKD domain-containing protein [Patescibacteria group bacterium]